MPSLAVLFCPNSERWSRCVSQVFILSCLYTLTACSPTFNWRDVRPEKTTLTAQFPCKPEKVVRALELAGQPVSMTMLFCEAGGATFTLAYADIKDTAMLPVTLKKWRQTTLVNFRAQQPVEARLEIAGSNPSTPPGMVTAQGIGQDGRSLSVHVGWFAMGSKAFQLAVTSDTPNAGVVEIFFAGIKSQ